MPNPIPLLWILALSCVALRLAPMGTSFPPLSEESSSAGIRLPAPETLGTIPVEEALRRRRSVRAFEPGPLPLAEVAQLLWAAQGITAAHGGRTAPSAGALYPLELYLVAGRVEGLPPGIYQYRPPFHDLLKRVEGDHRVELATASRMQPWVQAAPACLVFAAVPKRTAWKYGHRALRYVQVEVGAAAENVSLQGVGLGLGSAFVGAFDDSAVKQILRLGPDEEPFLVLPFGRVRP